ncbi:hypothetical protein STEG23_034840 [Scotinomys teguina]
MFRPPCGFLFPFFRWLVSWSQLAAGDAARWYNFELSSIVYFEPQKFHPISEHFQCIVHNRSCDLPVTSVTIKPTQCRSNCEITAVENLSQGWAQESSVLKQAALMIRITDHYTDEDKVVINFIL